MHRIFLILLVLTQGCGSVFIEAPAPHPDFDTCFEFSDTLSASTQNTPAPIPFWGHRKTTLSTRLPENWEQFTGSVHLVALAWSGVDWVSSMALYVEHLLVAKWDGSTWKTFPDKDLRPALTVFDTDRGKRLKFEAKAKSQGVKPAGTQVMAATVTVQLCGDGAEWVVPFGQPFDAE